MWKQPKRELFKNLEDFQENHEEILRHLRKTFKILNTIWEKLGKVSENV